MATTVTTPERSLAGIRVLVVDDTEDTLLIFIFFLENLGALVTTARSALEALAIITREPLDVLISDIGLPEVDGYELMCQVRALPADQGGQLPAIAMTGYVSQQDVEAAMAAGFQLHLPKPVEFDALADAIYSLTRG